MIGSKAMLIWIEIIVFSFLFVLQVPLSRGIQGDVTTTTLPFIPSQEGNRAPIESCIFFSPFLYLLHFPLLEERD
jgi:hypothetical protein